VAKVFDSLSTKNRQQRNAMHDLCRQYNRAPSKGHLKKLKQVFQRYGKDVFIEQGFYCDYGDKISLGERVYFNINCTLLDGGNIVIGDDVLVGPNVQILTVNHPMASKERLNKTNLVKDVLIGNNVWIGAGVIILPGVSIGDGTVIGAGSVVSKSLDGYSLYLGNPAIKIKALE
jgi:maltose O-acetyltransferase